MNYNYHFDVGNSNTGPVGFCVVVEAQTKELALNILKKHLPENVDVRLPFETGILSADVYLNPDNVTVDDIDSITDENGDEVDDANDYIVVCPDCASEFRLFVVEANGVPMHSQLIHDGFHVPDDVRDAVRDDDYSTVNERVRCEDCGAEFDLSELMVQH